MPEAMLGGGRCSYIDAGNGPVILLIHSLGTSNHLWHRVIPQLTRSYRVIAPDLLGHGASGPPAYEFGLPDHADSLVELMTGLECTPFVVAGTSVGGLLGIELASRYGHMVRGLVVNGAPGWHLESQRMARLRTVSGMVGADGHLLDDAPASTGTVRPMSEDDLARRKADHRRVGRWFISTMWAIAAYDPIARLPAISCPSRVLMGDADFHLPTSYSIVDGIAGCTMRVRGNAGHLTPYDDPDWIAQELLEFLATEVGSIPASRALGADEGVTR